jgi:Na+-transporting NADH:ubiquinone oxidoreductase subunit A
MTAAATTEGVELRFRLRRGLDLDIGSAADPTTIHPGPEVRSVALLGRDAAGARLEPRVAPGERVRLGQTLAVDRRRPAIRFTSPGAGVVRSVERGPRRRVESIAIDLDGDEAECFEVADAERVPVESALLASGLWTALRTRPFSRIPSPGSVPHAIFVTAMDTAPLAPPASPVIEERADDFALGVAALAALTDGRVYVCAAPRTRIPLSPNGRVRVARFQGPHPAGLPGTHIRCIDPVSAERTVWHAGHADAIAIGALLRTGVLPTERVISLAGPAVARPRLVRTRLGACTDDLLRGELVAERCRVISGSVLDGDAASGGGAYLGRLHAQVSAIPEPDAAASAATVFFPLDRLDRALPRGIPVAPLLRALVVGDAEAAAHLGALELAEEDLALASYLCPGKLDYGALLRAVLDELEP